MKNVHPNKIIMSLAETHNHTNFCHSMRSLMCEEIFHGYWCLVFSNLLRWRVWIKQHILLFIISYEISIIKYPLPLEILLYWLCIREFPSNTCRLMYQVVEYILALLCFMITSSNGNIFRVTVPLRGEFTGPRWIPRTKASDAELWCFLWSAPE